jgi:hypothetical protein
MVFAAFYPACLLVVSTNGLAAGVRSGIQRYNSLKLIPKLNKYKQIEKLSSRYDALPRVS